MGRHHSYTELQKGGMVVSAHCPGKNTQPGIEHEHNGAEAMTDKQFVASAWLHAWIIDRCGMRGPAAIHPHREYFATSCPGSLASAMPAHARRVAQILTRGKP